MFFSVELGHFLGQKIPKQFFLKKNIFQNCLQQNFSLNFMFHKAFKFFSKKQKMEKNVFLQKQFWKIFFLEQKNVLEFFVTKK
jgi:hypothetical protein